MCATILASAKWLSFLGMLLTTLAALMLVVKGSELYHWMRRKEVMNALDTLRKVAAKHERLDAATTVPPMLEGSEVVTERLNLKRKGGLFGLALARRSWTAVHDRLRRELHLPFRLIERPNGIVRLSLVEASFAEVSDALEISIAETELSDSRYLKGVVLIFLAGSIFQLIAGTPWC